MKTKLRRKVLLYTRSPDNRGLVLAEKARAECVARVHRAIETASTWAEFRHLMPARGYSEVMHMIDDNGEPRPRSTEPSTPTACLVFLMATIPLGYSRRCGTCFRRTSCGSLASCSQRC